MPFFSPLAISPYNRLRGGGTGVIPFSGLLDAYPNAAAAYSVRQLSSTYTGALVEIRRESDDTAKSFYSDSNNELSLTSPDVNGVTLGTWIGSSDGFVRTWYDQSGNSIDFIQATTSEQPKIITAGAFTLESSKPVITFDGTDDYFNATLSAASTNAYQSLANYKAISVPTVGATTIGSEGLNDKRYWYRDNTDSRIRNGGASEGVFTYLSSNSLVQIIYDGTTTVDVYENNSVLETGTISGSSSTEEIWIGDWASTGRPMNFSLSEFIDWQDDDDSRVSGVKTNQNDYYNIYSPPGAFIIATGGTITTDGDYKVHSFSSSANFTVTSLGSDPTYGDKIDYLAVAGGGGGGTLLGAGGGAGGLLTATSATVSAIAYAATVGGGGAGATVAKTRGGTGSNSTFYGVTAIGGGGGAANAAGQRDGGSGGSGGGAVSSGTPGAGTAGQGNEGGAGSGTGVLGQGGGGGAGAVGGDATSTNGGDGGVGLQNSITGTALYYAGGGGGSAYAPSGGIAGEGGEGGGGDGGTTAGSDADANTGGGGGGSDRDTVTPAGGNGGSGIVIVRYKFQ